jgi:endonuclease G, mitochondrial
MDETFILSNIAPQVGDGFNRHCEPFVPYRFSTLLFIIPLDWAYVEDWCRRLTGSFKDVYVFTIPLYLPRQETDGKWRVVSRYRNNLKPTLLELSSWQTHEVIGSPPNVSVPTHFAKVVLASKPSSPSTLDILELSTGAFVLPNAVIRDDTPLENFIVPGKCLFEG